MKRLKNIEVTTFRGERYLRIWQYAARGGKSLAYQVRVGDGLSPSEVLAGEKVQSLLKEEFGLKST